MLIGALFLLLQLFDGLETQELCTQYNLAKLARSLFRWTGQARYVDLQERALLNGVMGAQRTPWGGGLDPFAEPSAARIISQQPQHSKPKAQVMTEAATRPLALEGAKLEAALAQQRLLSRRPRAASIVSQVGSSRNLSGVAFSHVIPLVDA